MKAKGATPSKAWLPSLQRGLWSCGWRTRHRCQSAKARRVLDAEGVFHALVDAERDGHAGGDLEGMSRLPVATRHADTCRALSSRPAARRTLTASAWKP